MTECGDICWVGLGQVDEGGHRPARVRPVLVVQADAYSASKLATVVVVALTSNLTAAAKPGNVLLPAGATGLPRDSVANVTQVATLSRYELRQPRAGRVQLHLMRAIDVGLAAVLGLELTP